MRPLVLLLSPRAVLLFALLFSLAVLVNLLGCLWWNIALDEGLENSWAARIGEACRPPLMLGVPAAAALPSSTPHARLSASAMHGRRAGRCAAAGADNKDFDLLTASDPARWLVSCYFALTTLVTIG